MASRYWVGGTANWDGTAGTKWATTDGGAGGAAVPTASDDVFFTAASGAVTVSQVNGYTPLSRNLDFTGFTGTFSMFNSVTSNNVISGGLTLGSGMSFLSGGSSAGFVFVATTDNGGAGWPITTNGKLMPPVVTFNGVGGKWTLQDTLTTYSTGGTTLTAGHLDTNNQTVNGWYFTTGGAGAKTLTLGSSTLTFSSGNTCLCLLYTSRCV